MVALLCTGAGVPWISLGTIAAWAQLTGLVLVPMVGVAGLVGVVAEDGWVPRAAGVEPHRGAGEDAEAHSSMVGALRAPRVGLSRVTTRQVGL